VMSTSVCASVCLSARISPEPQARSLLFFRLSPGDVLIDLGILNSGVSVRPYVRTSVRPQKVFFSDFDLITFCVSRRRRKMYCGRSPASVCLCVCLSVRGRTSTLCTDPDVTWVSGRDCPLVVHYWTNLQSVHGFRGCPSKPQFWGPE